MLESMDVAVPALMALVFAAVGVGMVGHADGATPSARLGIDQRRLGLIGVLQVMGAMGLLLGLAWSPLGVAAAAGLILLMMGAVATHVRIGDPALDAAPAVICLVGATGAAALFLV